MELENNASDPSDTGTVWFSDSLAQEKIVNYLSSEDRTLLKHDTTILDLGTGNGEMLFALRENGNFFGKMLGIDYSVQSVELAGRVAEKRGLQHQVEFRVWDILDSHGESQEEHELGEWGVVLDKGTFDAVSLSGVPDVEERYVRQVEKLVAKGGLVLVTSCNWTEVEVKRWFEGGGQLTYHGRISYPTFRFGGATGQSISTICFKREFSSEGT